MDTDFKKVRDQIIETNADTKTLFGMHHTVKRLMSVMYYYENPLTLDDMTELLGMSKGSMSNAIRELLEMGLVQKIWKNGERKDFYKVEEDNYECFIKYFSFNWRKLLVPKSTSIKNQINQLNLLRIKDNIDDETSNLIDKDLKKLYDALDYIEWLDGIAELFESHEIFNYVPKKTASKKYKFESQLEKK